MQQQDSPIELFRRGQLRIWISRPYMARRWQGVFKVQRGLGAGYKGGWTFFVAVNMREGKPWGGSYLRRRRLLQVGFTRNGNVIPCA
jgi:hypothetical protein